MGLLNMLGFGTSTESIEDFIAKGAVVIDVRTVGEFSEGHIKGSKNIPLDTIAKEIQTIKKMNKPVITCCRSGMRSAQAASILKQNGITCVNGGSWTSLDAKL